MSAVVLVKGRCAQTGRSPAIISSCVQTVNAKLLVHTETGRPVIGNTHILIEPNIDPDTSYVWTVHDDHVARTPPIQNAPESGT